MRTFISCVHLRSVRYTHTSMRYTLTRCVCVCVCVFACKCLYFCGYAARVYTSIHTNIHICTTRQENTYTHLHAAWSNPPARVHVYTYMHAYIHTHSLNWSLPTAPSRQATHTCINTYMQTYIHTQPELKPSNRSFTSSNTYYVYMHTCIHTYIHTHTQPGPKPSNRPLTTSDTAASVGDAPQRTVSTSSTTKEDATRRNSLSHTSKIPSYSSSSAPPPSLLPGNTPELPQSSIATAVKGMPSTGEKKGSTAASLGKFLLLCAVWYVCGNQGIKKALQPALLTSLSK
jgi:hypothetical protein